jgi:GH15 family glucan-1,4-alpha-glucosidase
VSKRIEDYALIGDTQTAALVALDGSIDWLCLPRFDSAACFAALLGDANHGHWTIAPTGRIRGVRRRYREETLVLETDLETDEGAVRLIDFMPPRTKQPDLIRIVEGIRGRVPMRMRIAIRFDYGSTVPWVRGTNGSLRAIAGPDALVLNSGVPMHGEDLSTVAHFDSAPGRRVAFSLTWHGSTEPPPAAINTDRALKETESWWRDWVRSCTYRGAWREPVIRSLLTLKALTYAPTGGMVAAPTTSLPERLGGVRNWDYRICWIRDATFTLYALLLAGYQEEARAWRDWLLRAVAGHPSQLQHMYGLSGERRMPELEIGWLPGYEASRPVRIGNAAAMQFQLDVFGEVLDSMHLTRKAGIHHDEDAWMLAKALLEHLESIWREPDEGIWEVRGPRRQFTHSKIMSWVAVDRAVKGAERYGLDGPVDRWRALRDEIHAEVCARAFDPERGTFVQAYDRSDLDAALLLIPLVGFLPASDERFRGTVRAIERELLVDGLVHRYSQAPAEVIDGLPPGEGAFLPCSFWLADSYALMGRAGEARELFERLLSLTNDVGLLAEEYDPTSRRMLGNFPLAMSHVSLVNAAHNVDATMARGERT